MQGICGRGAFRCYSGDDIVYTGNGEPALKQLMDRYYETGSTVVGCQVVPEEKVSSYGIIQEKNGESGPAEGGRHD